MWPLTPLMDNLYAFTRMTVKIRLSGDTWKPYNSTLVHKQYIGKKTQVVFLLLKIKELLLELNPLTSLSVFYKKKLTMVFLFQHIRSLVSLHNICAPKHVKFQLSVGILN